MPTMLRTVLTFGLLAGLMLSAMLVLTQPFREQIGYGVRGMVIGYATMVAASLFVYFGVRRYRDTTAGGTVRFGRAFIVGLLIVAVSSACYTATWEIIYFGFDQDFMAQYRDYTLAQQRAAGATVAQLARQRAELDALVVAYDRPLVNIAYTLLEPLPVGVLAALLSAAVLRRREPQPAPALVRPA